MINSNSRNNQEYINHSNFIWNGCSNT